MLSKMNPRWLQSAGTGQKALIGEIRRNIFLTSGREFIKDSAKRVIASQEVKAPPAAPDLPNFVDMRQGEKVRQWSEYFAIG